MDEQIEALVVSVRADTSGFARDVASMQGSLTEGLGGAAGRAGGMIESALARSIRSGKLGFDDLKRVALGVMNEIAAAAVRNGVGSILGGSGGLLSAAGSLLGGVLGLPGRATGGPVTAGRGYLVGERGAELFVPGSGGQVVPLGGGGVSARDVRVSIAINAAGGGEPQALARSGRQVARAVRAALEKADG